MSAERPASLQDVRAELARRGWRSVAAVACEGIPHGAVERRVRAGLEAADGVLVLLSEDASGLPIGLRLEAWRRVRETYLPADRVLEWIVPGGTEIDELLRVSRALEGVRAVVHEPSAENSEALVVGGSFFCRECGTTESERTCPHPASARLAWSERFVRETLRSGGVLPEGFLRREIAALLRMHYLAEAGVLGANAQAGAIEPATLAKKGFILWFTGLSGAGKSTLSREVGRVLAGQLDVEILDGDEVRAYLSKGLGFSREDRDINVRRIGYVARLLARHGTVAITAAISPYADIRNEVRRHAEGEGIPFIEVYAEATVEALAARDVKGLYRKALAGEIAHFTGVSDPYEPPADPEVTVRTDHDSVEESVARIVEELRARGLLPTDRRAA